MTELHTLLRRQLRRAGVGDAAVSPGAAGAATGLAALIASVNQAYHQADDDRRMLERSIEISSRELSESNRSLRAAKEAAERAAQAKGEFLANMSHEIRTPMNAVVGLTELLLETPLAADQREFLRTIRTASESLLEILNDILDFSRIDNHRVELEQVPFSLRGCVEASVELFGARVAPAAELIASIDADVPDLIRGDANRLRQILINLLGNAVKFTSEGEIEVTVSRTGTDREDEDSTELEFRVRDTGIGIPADRMDRLFKSFSQVDCSTTRRYGGTGLGLAISTRLAELMGGRMWAESDAGRGSTFHFTVVVKRGGADAEARPLASKRVKLAVANRAVKAALERQLTHLGAALTEADNVDYEILVADEDLIDTVLSEGTGGPDSRVLRVVLTAPGLQPPKLPANWQGSRLLSKPVRETQLARVLLDPVREDPEPSRAPASAPSRVCPLRVLAAEDNRVNQTIIVAMLERFGVAVDLASNGREALRAIERTNYDLLLMDMHMPEMDGIEATREIRRRMAGQTGPRIVALTASAMLEDRERCLEAGMDGYLSKPVRLEDLRALLDELGSTADPVAP